MCKFSVVAASKYLKWFLIKLNSYYLHSYRTQAFQEVVCGFGNMPGVVSLRSYVWLEKKTHNVKQSIQTTILLRTENTQLVHCNLKACDPLTNEQNEDASI